MVLLATAMMPLLVWGSWFAIDQKVRGYYALLLALKTGMIGVFVSLDLFLFYCFWELLLIPMYFLIGTWGSSNRLYAATKFVVYTFAGSILMLVAIITMVTIVARGSGSHLVRLRPPACSTATCWRRTRRGSSVPSRSRSRSRCRSSRSTPGCPMRTSRHPPRAASTSP